LTRTREASCRAGYTPGDNPHLGFLPEEKGAHVHRCVGVTSQRTLEIFC
jgi:hypothetical protein